MRRQRLRTSPNALPTPRPRSRPHRPNSLSVAQAAYRDGGDMGELGAVVTANGFEDAITSSEVMTRASDEMATLVQRVQAAQLVADTMRNAAVDAEARAAEAATAASDAYDKAEAAATSATQAVEDADAVREDAMNRLAELQGTTVYLEKERQAGLAADRDAKRQAAAQGGSACRWSSGSSGSGLRWQRLRARRRLRQHAHQDH